MIHEIQFRPEAGVKVEQAIMTFILGSYCEQSNLRDLAAQRFREAAVMAEDAHAFPQVAQARMAIAYVMFKNELAAEAAKEYELAAEAAKEYELAAEAALKGRQTMLYIEALRMSGTCYLQNGKIQEAFRCWKMVLQIGKTESLVEIKNSNFREVCELLVKLLRKYKLEDEARRVESEINQVMEKARSPSQEAEL